MSIRRPLLTLFTVSVEKPILFNPQIVTCAFHGTIQTRSRSQFRWFSSAPAKILDESSIFNLMRRYEDLIGLTEVKEAQRAVLQAERNFQQTQQHRREKQDEINRVQDELREIRSELDKCSRGEDRYLSLLTREHNVIKEEQRRLDEFKKLEQTERDCFAGLSARLRESHEKERERGEKTKYWSIIGSITGAAIGIIGTTINNRLRLREVKNIVHEAADPTRFQSVISQLSDTVRTQQQQVGTFVNDLKSMLNNEKESQSNPALLITPLASQLTKDADRWLSPQQGTEILSAIKDQDEKIEKEMDEIKQMIATERGYSMKQDGSIVYVGPEMTHLLDQTEKNIEMKMKLNTLTAVVAVYGGLAITLPLLYAIFRGG